MQSIEEIYEMYSRKVFLFLLSKTNNEHLAEELTQETFFKPNPLKKVRFYQKMLTVLGAVIAFVLGACYPIAILGLTVLERGEIAAYQIERLKNLWYVLALRSCVAGIIVCAIYFLLILLIGKIISGSAGKV